MFFSTVEVALQDNFFHLGYTSLTITAFKVQVETRLGIAIEKAQEGTQKVDGEE